MQTSITKENFRISLHLSSEKDDIIIYKSVYGACPGISNLFPQLENNRVLASWCEMKAERNPGLDIGAFLGIYKYRIHTIMIYIDIWSSLTKFDVVLKNKNDENLQKLERCERSREKSVILPQSSSPFLVRSGDTSPKRQTGNRKHFGSACHCYQFTICQRLLFVVVHRIANDGSFSPSHDEPSLSRNSSCLVFRGFQFHFVATYTKSSIRKSIRSTIDDSVYQIPNTYLLIFDELIGLVAEGYNLVTYIYWDMYEEGTLQYILNDMIFLLVCT